MTTNRGVRGAQPPTTLEDSEVLIGDDASAYDDDEADRQSAEALAKDRRRFLELDEEVLSRSSSMHPAPTARGDNARPHGVPAAIAALESSFHNVQPPARARPVTAVAERFSVTTGGAVNDHSTPSRAMVWGETANNTSNTVASPTYDKAEMPNAASAAELFRLRERVKTLELQNTVLRMARRPPSLRRVAHTVSHQLAQTTNLKLLARYWIRFRIWSAVQRFSTTAIHDHVARSAHRGGPVPSPRAHGAPPSAPPATKHQAQPHTEPRHRRRTPSPARQSMADYFEDDPQDLANGVGSRFLATGADDASSHAHTLRVMTDVSSPTLELQRYAARLTSVCHDQRDVIETLRLQLTYAQERIAVREAPEHLHAKRQCEIACRWAAEVESWVRAAIARDEALERKAYLDTTFETFEVKLQSLRWALELETVWRFRSKDIEITETHERLRIVAIEGPERALAAALEANRRLRAEVSKRELSADPVGPVNVAWPQRGSATKLATPPRPDNDAAAMTLTSPPPVLFTSYHAVESYQSPPGRRSAGSVEPSQAPPPPPPPLVVSSPVRRYQGSPSVILAPDDVVQEHVVVDDALKAVTSPPPRLISPPLLTEAVTLLPAAVAATLLDQEAMERKNHTNAFLDEYDALMEFFIQRAIELEERTMDPERNYSFASMVTSDGGE